jgi:hypothetical protein
LLKGSPVANAILRAHDPFATAVGNRQLEMFALWISQQIAKFIEGVHDRDSPVIGKKNPALRPGSFG